MISLESLFHNYHCTRAGHGYQPIQLICLDKDCQEEMKLMCLDCQQIHTQCRTSNPRLLDMRFEQQQQNFFQVPAQGIVESFTLVKQRIIQILDRISVEINQIVAPTIPNLIDAYNQLCNRENKPYDTNYFIKEYQSKLMTLVFQEQTMMQQKPLKMISEYTEKFNKWLEVMPKISFKPITDIILRDPHQEHGDPTYISIKDLVQSFKVNQKCKLISLIHGVIKRNHENDVSDMGLHIKIYKSTDLRKDPIYDNRIIKSSELNQYAVKSNLIYPIYLEADQIYTIVSNLHEKLLIIDFRQDIISNGTLITQLNQRLNYFPLEMNDKRRNHIAGFYFERLFD